MDSLGALLPFVIILLAFWLLIIRPARNRQRSQHQLQGSLAVGQQVMTTSGLYATVSGVEEEAVLLEVAPGVTMRWAKQAVARVVTPGEGEPRPDGDSGAPDEGATGTSTQPE